MLPPIGAERSRIAYQVGPSGECQEQNERSADRHGTDGRDQLRYASQLDFLIRFVPVKPCVQRGSVFGATGPMATVTVGGEGGIAGAVYTPEEETIPNVELPPAMPFTVQATAVFEVPVTVAVNCWIWPTWTEAIVGVIDTDTTGRTVIGA